MFIRKNGWNGISNLERFHKQGSFYETNPNNTLFIGEIPQNYCRICIKNLILLTKWLRFNDPFQKSVSGRVRFFDDLIRPQIFAHVLNSPEKSLELVENSPNKETRKKTLGCGCTFCGEPTNHLLTLRSNFSRSHVVRWSCDIHLLQLCETSQNNNSTWQLTPKGRLGFQFHFDVWWLQKNATNVR